MPVRTNPYRRPASAASLSLRNNFNRRERRFRCYIDACLIVIIYYYYFHYRRFNNSNVCFASPNSADDRCHRPRAQQASLYPRDRPSSSLGQGMHSSARASGWFTAPPSAVGVFPQTGELYFSFVYERRHFMYLCRAAGLLAYRQAYKWVGSMLE